MRERIARGVLVLTFATVLGLASLFAILHNPSRSGATTDQPMPAETTAPPPMPGEPSPEQRAEASPTGPTRNRVLALEVDWGRRVFFEQNCTACHAVGGEGNPRLPLDGVGDRETLEGLRIWVTGTGEAATQLSAGVRRKKQAYQTLPDAEMNALIVFLSSLRAPSP